MILSSLRSHADLIVLVHISTNDQREEGEQERRQRKIRRVREDTGSNFIAADRIARLHPSPRCLSILPQEKAAERVEGVGEVPDEKEEDETEAEGGGRYLTR